MQMIFGEQQLKARDPDLQQPLVRLHPAVQFLWKLRPGADMTWMQRDTEGLTLKDHCGVMSSGG